VPIYEYRCPDGHVFELFHRMDDPPPEACSICGKSPVEKVLYPVAVHFKGSGFYSTDYGRSRKTGKDSDGSSGGDDSKSEPKTTEKPKSETSKSESETSKSETSKSSD
jgi:putative FmdB family regulatory protein